MDDKLIRRLQETDLFAPPSEDELGLRREERIKNMTPLELKDRLRMEKWRRVEEDFRINGIKYLQNVESKRVTIAELPPKFQTFLQILADNGVVWEYGQRFNLPQVDPMLNYVRTASAAYGTYKRYPISIGSKLGCSKSSAGAWSDFNGHRASTIQYSKAVERLLKFMKKADDGR